MSFYDSKLFFGMKLDSMTQVVDELKKHYTYVLPTKTKTQMIQFMEWVNTQIPDDVFLDVAYTRFSDPVTQFSVHINMINDIEGLNQKQLVDHFNNINVPTYENFVRKLGYTPQPPTLYLVHYIYD